MASYRGLRALHICSLVMVVDARDPQFYRCLDLEPPSTSSIGSSHRTPHTQTHQQSHTQPHTQSIKPEPTTATTPTT